MSGITQKAEGVVFLKIKVLMDSGRNQRIKDLGLLYVRPSPARHEHTQRSLVRSAEKIRWGNLDQDRALF